MAQIAAILGKSYSNIWNTVHRNQKSGTGDSVTEKPREAVCCTKEVIKKCIYGDANGVPSCNYIGITGHKRGCDPDHCTEFVRK